jgi:hypothetical protein
MDLVKVLAELRSELDVLNQAIESLERLQEVKPRRGRPPARSVKFEPAFHLGEERAAAPSSPGARRTGRAG